MINEEDKKKIRLMTRISIYEKTEGKKNEATGDYFRFDYIGLKIIGAVISATMVFCIVAGLYVLCYYDTLMNEVYEAAFLQQFVTKLIWYYIGFVGVYLALIVIVFFAKYSKAIRYKRIFSKNLKKLLSHYKGEEDLDDGYDTE